MRLIVLGVLFVLPAVASAGRPNVLLLIADDLSATALGCYGNAQVRSPNIDGLAERSVRFERAYCNYPVCGPSRCSMMSGRDCESTGVMSNHSDEDGSVLAGVFADGPSLSQHLMAHGYWAGRSSKIYHMRIPGDITAGISGPDHRASWMEVFNAKAPEQWTEGERLALDNSKYETDPAVHLGAGYGGGQFRVITSTDGSEQADVLAADHAIRMLSEQDPNTTGRPFFLAVGFVRPHVPYVATRAEYDVLNAAEMPLPETPADDWDDIPKPGMGYHRTSDKLLPVADEGREVLRSYYATVEFMDRQVGRVLHALDAAGLRENTVVIFKSDHGYHLGEHRMWSKQNLHENVARIPLMIDAPGVEPGETDALVSQIDLYPTVCELAGLPVPAEVQGRSFLPTLKDPSTPHKDHVTTVFRVNKKKKIGGRLLRTDRWAYMRYDDGSEELYDMDEDPEQFTNLAALRRDVCSELSETIDVIRRERGIAVK